LESVVVYRFESETHAIVVPLRRVPGILLPHTDPLLSPILAVVPLHMLAMAVAGARGVDVDQPRNLAKSVTVE
jgi:glucosamine 6-phosphate synthetase-like amidotransferase/phosphosugar isomerase protein